MFSTVWKTEIMILPILICCLYLQYRIKDRNHDFTYSDLLSVSAIYMVLSKCLSFSKELIVRLLHTDYLFILLPSTCIFKNYGNKIVLLKMIISPCFTIFHMYLYNSWNMNSHWSSSFYTNSFRAIYCKLYVSAGKLLRCTSTIACVFFSSFTSC